MFAFASSLHDSASSFPSLPSSHRSRSNSTPLIQTRIASHHLKAARQRNRSHDSVLTTAVPKSRALFHLLFFLGALSVVAVVLTSGDVRESWGGMASESRYPVSRAMEQINTAQAATPTHTVHPIIRKRHHSPALASQVAFSSLSTPHTAPTFTPTQELAALTHFLVSSSHGSLPLIESYSPSSTPLSPEWVLDFDLAASDGMERMKVFQHEVWENEGKLVVFGRQGDVWTREILKMLKEDNRVREVALIDVDARADKEVVQPILDRLLATPSFPLVLLGGHHLGGYPELKELNQDRLLGSMLASRNVLIEPLKKSRRSRVPTMRRR